MASQEVIKELGTNGGGFVNANSASPNENPTPFSNLVEMWLIFLISAALTYTFGRMVKDQRQGWAIFVAMAILFAGGFAAAYSAEAAGNPIVHALGVHGGNMEGKECRFGVGASALFATVTTDTSCGAVNSMHDSFTPLGGLVPLVNMQLGEDHLRRRRHGHVRHDRVRRADGVHRRPDGRAARRNISGKRSSGSEVQLAILAVLVLPLFSLVPTAIAAVATARASDAWATTARTDSRRSSTRSPRRPKTTAARSPGLSGNTFYNVADGHLHALRPLRVHHPGRSRSPGRSPARKPSRRPPARSRTNSPIFVALLHRRHRHRRRADVLARPTRWARSSSTFKCYKERRSKMISQRRLERRPQARSLFDRDIIDPRDRRLVQEARSALASAQPRHVHRRSRRGS